MIFVSVLLFRRSITNKLLLAFFAVFILLTILEYSEYCEHRRNSRILARQVQIERTQTAVAVINDTVDSAAHDLRLALHLLNGKFNQKSVIPLLRSIVAENPSYISAGLLDPDTRRIIHYPGSPIFDIELPPVRTASLPAVSGINHIGNGNVYTVGISISAKNGKPGIIYVLIKSDKLVDNLTLVFEKYQHGVILDQYGQKICDIGNESELNTHPNSTFAENTVVANHKYAKNQRYTATSALSGWKILVEQPENGPSEFNYSRVKFAWYSAVALLVAAVVFRIGNHIASPMRKLTRAAEAVSVGDFRRRVHVETGDELQFLAESFNQMTESLDQQRQSLRLNANVQQSLLEVARAVTSSLDLDEVAHSIAESLKTQLGVQQAFIFRVDDVTGNLEPLLWPEESATLTAKYRPLAEKTLDDPSGHIIGNADDETAMALPLIAASKPIGVLVAAFHSSEYSKEAIEGQMDFLKSFASCAAIAVHNAQTHGQTEELIHILDCLRQVDEAISTSLDLKQVLRSLVTITTEVMNAKACAILLTDGHGRLTVAESYNLSKDLCERLIIEPGEKWSSLVFGQQHQIAEPDVLSDYAQREGLRRFVSAPLIIGHEALGAIDVWMDRPHQAKKTEIDLLGYIANHAAAVIANARLFGKEYQIAETLQNTLLTDLPETLGKLEFGHKYLPAPDEARVGGDLFDVVPLPNGRIALIVADVSGKGIQAAVHTAMIRYMARAFLFEWPESPSVVLNHLNQSLLMYFGPKTVVTVFCSIIDPETGEVSYSNAGHPPAIVVTKQGKQQTLLYRTGMPIGYAEDSAYDERHEKLEAGDTIILYTDGIIEARRDRKMLTIEGLQDIIFDHSHLSPHEMVEAICEETGKFARRDLRDDIAIMAAGYGLRVEKSADAAGSKEGTS